MRRCCSEVVFDFLEPADDGADGGGGGGLAGGCCFEPTAPSLLFPAAEEEIPAIRSAICRCRSNTCASRDNDDAPPLTLLPLPGALLLVVLYGLAVMGLFLSCHG